MTIKLSMKLPSRILFQSQQWEHQNNVWNLFKINKKETGVFIVKSELIPHLVLVFLLLTLIKYMPARNLRRYGTVVRITHS